MGKDEKKSVTSDVLKQLAAQKEKEWKDVQELRANSLELTVKELEKELLQDKSKFAKLKEDFKYNLKLLKERDNELEKYDLLFTEMKTCLTQKEADLSDAKIKLDELKTSVEREAKAREEMQAHYQHRVREKQAELEDYRRVKDTEVQQERESLETVKRHLERQLRELEDEIDTQKRELTIGFDEALRKREHEFRKQADEMSSTVLAHEMKVKLLTKELELARAAERDVSLECEKVSTDTRDLEKKLKQKDWQLQDMATMKEAQIKELQQKLHSTECAMNRLQEEFQRKHSELDRYSKEKESALMKTKEAAGERERHLEGEVRELQSKVEGGEMRYRQLEWEKQDMERVKDTSIERLQDELSDIRGRWDNQKSELNRDTVARDMELEALRQTELKLKEDLLQRKHDIDRYKKELQQSLERETSLERSKAQVELDWQRRCENLERQQYERSEDLVKQLTEARDQAQATLKEKLRELRHKTDLMKVLTEDRDRALATLKQHGLVADQQIDLSRFEEELPKSATETIERLQAQNENLRQVIHQMRTEMEKLGGEMKPDKDPAATSSSKQPGSLSVAAEYVRNLETEVRELKIRCRKLQNEATDLEAGQFTEGKLMETVGDNTVVKSHIEQLNNTIGGLRSEKVELTAQSRKQQARIQYLEALMDNLAKEPRDKQVQIEQLQYELAAQTRRHQAELGSSKQRISDLEMQLLETRKEADEYMKATIERNTEITALGQELSTMKMELADGRPMLNFGAQELLIQQLQDEIQQLRNQLKGQGQIYDPVTLNPSSGKAQGQTTNATIAQLQNKLRMAAKQISQLAKEKQQLIEMGNRLRARLKENGVRPPSPPARPLPAFPSAATVSQQQQRHDTSGPKFNTDLQEKIHSKLSQLETLQYELTKQELAYKQRMSPTRPHVPSINLESSQEYDDDNQPKSILKKSVEFDKLSPVPENKVPISRPKTAPMTTAAIVQTSRNARQQAAATSRSDTGGQQRSASPNKEAGYGLRVSMSSVGGESLQEIWKMLDEGTPRTCEDSAEGPFTGLSFPGDRHGDGNRPNSNSTQSSWMVKGQPSALKPKPSKEPKSSKLTPRTAGQASAKKPQQPKTKIRNYNWKDDGIR